MISLRTSSQAVVEEYVKEVSWRYVEVNVLEVDQRAEQKGSDQPISLKSTCELVRAIAFTNSRQNLTFRRQ